MDYRVFEELEEKLAERLEDIAEHKRLDMGDIEVIDKITHSMKCINSIKDVSSGRMYDDTKRHLVRAHYSYADGLEDELKKMLHSGNMSSNDKEILEEAMRIVRR